MSVFLPPLILSMSAEDINYSEKYSDDKYDYRHVTLPTALGAKVKTGKFVFRYCVLYTASCVKYLGINLLIRGKPGSSKYAMNSYLYTNLWCPYSEEQLRVCSFESIVSEFYFAKDSRFQK